MLKMMILVQTEVALIVLLASLPTIIPAKLSAKSARLGNTKKNKDKRFAKSATLANLCLIQEVSTFFIDRKIHVKYALVLRVRVHVLLLQLLYPYIRYFVYTCAVVVVSRT